MRWRKENERESELVPIRERREKGEGVGKATLRGHPHPRLEKVFVRV